MEICSSQKASSSEYLEYLSYVWLFDLEYSNPQTKQIVLGLPYSVASTLRPKKSPGRQLLPIVIDHHDLVVSSPPLARLGMAVARFFYYLALIVFKASFFLNHKTKTTLNVKQCESAIYKTITYCHTRPGSARPRKILPGMLEKKLPGRLEEKLGMNSIFHTQVVTLHQVKVESLQMQTLLQTSPSVC
jgi:hypothetical protein